MKIRAISALLALVLAISLIPAPQTADAAALSASEIQKQIRSAYQRSLSASGRENFNGYCGTLVSWQMFCLGIDRKIYAADGKRQYDLYSAMDMTTGGYRVKSYPASKYSLKEALNAITNNGTIDAYNMVVGFEKTNTAAGSIYGHALVVHAILDGVVYFVECFDASIAGRYWAEGEPISCTIDQFCTYYDRWTVFDGIAYFGLKSYADMCEDYACNMQAMVTENAVIYKEPGDPGVYDPEASMSVIAGQWLQVTGLYKTPYGKYWYRVRYGDKTGYAEAEKLAMESLCADDVTIKSLRVPTNLHKGYSFVVQGSVSAEVSQVDSVTVTVCSQDGQTQHSGTAQTKNGKTALNSSSINNALPFRKMPAGTYELTVEAAVTIHVLEDGAVVTKTETVELHRSQFQIVTDWDKYCTVSFNGNGGEALTDQMVVGKGYNLGTLTTAWRSGYAFAGWTLDKEGTQPFAEETVINANTTLYAQWTPGHAGTEGWQHTENGSHYCDGDSAVEGWITFEKLHFYQHDDGSLATGWAWIDGGLRYFNEAGVLITQLQGEDGRVYCLNTDGKGVLGWNIVADAPSEEPSEGDTEDLLDVLEETDKLSAAGLVMQRLSACIYQIAVEAASGEITGALDME